MATKAVKILDKNFHISLKLNDLPISVAVGIIITLVHRDPLGMLRGGRRTFNDNTCDGVTHHFHIMPMGALHSQPHRDAMPFSQQAALDATFAPVGRVGAGLVTPQGGFGDGTCLL